MSEQMELSGMPDPIEGSSPVVPTWDEDAVRDLLDDPDASVVHLLDAICSTSAAPQLRDALLLHPAASGIDVLAAVRTWSPSLRDRAMSVTDQRAAVEAWAGSPDPFERAVAAMNPHCPPDIVERLAEDPQPGVRANAACCPQLRNGTRARLAHRDPDEDVRDFVAWLITSDDGRTVVEGSRYAKVGDGPVFRMIAYGMSRGTQPPV